MAIPALSNFAPSEVEGVLAKLASAILPNPGVEPSRESERLDPSLQEELLNQIRVSLRLRRNDDSPDARAKIYRFLAEELSKAALAGVDIKAVKSRLGQRGRLSADLYEIKFSDYFREGTEKRGLRKDQVEDTLRHPDEIEHLHPELYGLNAQKATSIYIKFFPQKMEINNFSILVMTHREGYVQVIGDAWRIYHSEVDISNAKSPLDVLRAFVEVYGEEIFVGAKRGKFFWYERVPVMPGQGATIVGLTRAEKDVDVTATAQLGRVEEGMIEIAHAFGINDTKYKNDMLKHKVRLSK